MTKYYGLIAAAGSGARFGAELPKQYAMLAGQPVLRHSIAALLGHAAIEEVYVVLSPDDTHWSSFDWSEFGARLRPVFRGAETRAESVRNGLEVVAQAARDNDWVLVHDGVRPCLSETLLAELIDTLAEDEVGGLLALPIADTLKRADGWNRVQSTEPRERLWQAQTPQMFRLGLLRRALAEAPAGVATDDAWAVERLGLRPRLVRGAASNIKITYAADLALAQLILKAR